MTTRPTLTSIFVAAWLLPATGHADVADYSSYDECILESLKGVSSDVAANAIIASCRSKFPEAGVVAPVPAGEAPEAPAVEASPAPAAAAAIPTAAAAVAGEPRFLTAEELANVKATLFVWGTQYRLTLENRNDDVTLTEMTISVWDDLDPRGLQTFTESMKVPPQETGKVTYEVAYMGDDQNWSWRIDSAKGTD